MYMPSYLSQTPALRFLGSASSVHPRWRNLEGARARPHAAIVGLLFQTYAQDSATFHLLTERQPHGR